MQINPLGIPQNSFVNLNKNRSKIWSIHNLSLARGPRQFGQDANTFVKSFLLPVGVVVSNLGKYFSLMNTEKRHKSWADWIFPKVHWFFIIFIKAESITSGFEGNHHEIDKTTQHFCHFNILSISKLARK